MSSSSVSSLVPYNSLLRTLVERGNMTVEGRTAIGNSWPTQCSGSAESEGCGWCKLEKIWVLASRCSRNIPFSPRRESLLAWWSIATAKVTNLLNDLDLTIEARGPAFYQGHIRSETHAIDVAARSEVIKCIEDDVEASEPVDVELRVHDVRVVRLELRTGLELLRNLLGNLAPSSFVRTAVGVWKWDARVRGERSGALSREGVGIAERRVNAPGPWVS